MRDRATSLRWLERVLLAVGVVSLGYYGYMTAEARQFQREQIAVFESRLDSALPLPAAPVAPAAPAAFGDGVLALLDIPRLNISTPVLSGDDAATLEDAHHVLSVQLHSQRAIASSCTQIG